MGKQAGRTSGVIGARHHSEILPRCCSSFRSRPLTIVALVFVAVVLAGVLFSSSATVVVAAPDDWPAYNHDASRSGVSGVRPSDAGWCPARVDLAGTGRQTTSTRSPWWWATGWWWPPRATPSSRSRQVRAPSCGRPTWVSRCRVTPALRQHRPLGYHRDAGYRHRSSTIYVVAFLRTVHITNSSPSTSTPAPFAGIAPSTRRGCRRGRAAAGRALPDGREGLRALRRAGRRLRAVQRCRGGSAGGRGGGDHQLHRAHHAHGGHLEPHRHTRGRAATCGWPPATRLRSRSSISATR